MGMPTEKVWGGNIKVIIKVIVLWLKVGALCGWGKIWLVGVQEQEFVSTSGKWQVVVKCGLKMHPQ